MYLPSMFVGTYVLTNGLDSVVRSTTIGGVEWMAEEAASSRAPNPPFVPDLDSEISDSSHAAFCGLAH